MLGTFLWEERHLSVNITWSHDRWVTWLDGCNQLILSHTLLKFLIYRKISLSTIEKYISRQMITRFLKIVSSIKSVRYRVRYRGFPIRIWPGLDRFLENLSAITRCPLYRMFAIATNFTCRLEILYAGLQRGSTIMLAIQFSFKKYIVIIIIVCLICQNK